MNYLVIDFGGTLAKYSVMTAQAEVLASGEKTAPSDSKEHFLSFITELYRELCGYTLAGVAISMPGIIDSDNGTLITAGSYLPLYGTDLKAELANQIPVPVTVENDGKCGALAEAWKGGLAECHDGIVLILGTGVAGGIIKDRRVHKGKHFSAGEFSYMLMDCEDQFMGTVLGKCGVSTLLFDACLKKGIDTAKCANHQLYSLFRKEPLQLSEWNDRPEYADGMNGYQFFELLEKEDPDIVQLYNQYVRNIARLILNLQLSFDPDKVLIGGGISRQPRLVEDIRAQFADVQKVYTGLLTLPCHIEVCRFGNEANQYGALYHHLNQGK